LISIFEDTNSQKPKSTPERMNSNTGAVTLMEGEGKISYDKGGHSITKGEGSWEVKKKIRGGRPNFWRRKVKARGWGCRSDLEGGKNYGYKPV